MLTLAESSCFAYPPSSIRNPSKCLLSVTFTESTQLAGERNGCIQALLIHRGGELERLEVESTECSTSHRWGVGREFLGEGGLVDARLEGAGLSQDIWDVAEVLLLVHDWEIVLVFDPNVEAASLHLLRCRMEYIVYNIICSFCNAQ